MATPFDNIFCNLTSAMSNYQNVTTHRMEFSEFLSNMTLPQWLLALILVFIIAVTVFGNILVILAISCDKLLQRPQYFLILSLAFADLMVGMAVAPLSALTYVTAGTWLVGDAACEAWIAVDVICCTASIWHLVAIAGDRYFSVKEITYTRNRTNSHIAGMVAVIWIGALVVSVGPALGWKDPDFNRRLSNQICLISQDVGYQLFSTTMAFYCPVILIIVIYVLIMRLARKRIDMKRKRRQPLVVRKLSSMFKRNVSISQAASTRASPSDRRKSSKWCGPVQIVLAMNEHKQNDVSREDESSDEESTSEPSLNEPKKFGESSFLSPSPSPYHSITNPSCFQAKINNVERKKHSVNFAENVVLAATSIVEPARRKSTLRFLKQKICSPRYSLPANSVAPEDSEILCITSPSEHMYPAESENHLPTTLLCDSSPTSSAVLEWFDSNYINLQKTLPLRKQYREAYDRYLEDHFTGGRGQNSVGRSRSITPGLPVHVAFRGSEVEQPESGIRQSRSMSLQNPVVATNAVYKKREHTITWMRHNDSGHLFCNSAVLNSELPLYTEMGRCSSQEEPQSEPNFCVNCRPVGKTPISGNGYKFRCCDHYDRTQNPASSREIGEGTSTTSVLSNDDCVSLQDFDTFSNMNHDEYYDCAESTRNEFSTEMLKVMENNLGDNSERCAKYLDLNNSFEHAELTSASNESVVLLVDGTAGIEQSSIYDETLKMPAMSPYSQRTDQSTQLKETECDNSAEIRCCSDETSMGPDINGSTDSRLHEKSDSCTAVPTTDVFAAEQCIPDSAYLAYTSVDTSSDPKIDDAPHNSVVINSNHANTGRNFDCSSPRHCSDTQTTTLSAPEQIFDTLECQPSGKEGTPTDCTMLNGSRKTTRDQTDSAPHLQTHSNIDNSNPISQSKNQNNCISIMAETTAITAKLINFGRRKRAGSLESKRERKAFTTLAIVTGTFLICWTPFFILALVRPLCNCHWAVWIDSTTTWLGYLNSGVNPIIYTVFSPEFRTGFKKLFLKILPSSCFKA